MTRNKLSITNICRALYTRSMINRTISPNEESYPLAGYGSYTPPRLAAHMCSKSRTPIRNHPSRISYICLMHIVTVAFSATIHMFQTYQYICPVHIHVHHTHRYTYASCILTYASCIQLNILSVCYGIYAPSITPSTAHFMC